MLMRHCSSVMDRQTTTPMRFDMTTAAFRRPGRSQARPYVVAFLAGIAATTWLPAADAIDPNADIARAIRELSEGNFATREAASQRLWDFGDAAEDALRAAARDDDPERAVRARQILDKLDSGVRTNTPPQLLELLARYERTPRSSWHPVLDPMLRYQEAGEDMIVALLLRETDPGIRSDILAWLGVRLGTIIGRLAADGDFRKAEKLLSFGLAHDVHYGDQWPYRIAEYALMRGTLDAEIARRTQAKEFTVLPALLKAAGRTEEAAAAAEKSGDGVLLCRLRALEGNWRAVVEYHGRTPNTNDIVWLGYEAAYRRLAGDHKEFAQALAAIEALGRAETNCVDDCAEALLLNEGPDRAIRYCIETGQYRSAADLLQARGQFTELAALAEKTRKESHSDFTNVIRVLAQTAEWLGESKAMEERFPEIKQFPQEPAAYTVARIEAGDKPAEVFARVCGGWGEEAHTWWNLLRNAYSQTNALSIAETVLKIAQQEPDEAAAAAFALPAVKEEDKAAKSIECVARTCRRANLTALATQILEDRTAAITNAADLWLLLGDIRREAGAWDQAVDCYQRAVLRDVEGMRERSPTAVFLAGHAKARLGRKAEGEADMRRAQWLCLGNPERRESFARSLEERGFKAEAAENRDIIRRTAPPTSWESTSALIDNDGRPAEQALWGQIHRLQFLRTYWTKSTTPEFLDMAQWDFKEQVRAHLEAGRPEEAFAGARACVDLLPLGSDRLCELYPLFLEKKRPDLAEKLFAGWFGFLQDVCREHPKTGLFRNIAAWAAARCRTRLDDALALATRAVELEPQTAAYLDTLAEVCFQRGEKQLAIDWMKKAIEIEPGRPYYRRQLKRFEAGDPKSDPK